MIQLDKLSLTLAINEHNLKDIKKIERSLETDQNVQIRIYIYFAMCTLSGVVGMVLVLVKFLLCYAISCFSRYFLIIIKTLQASMGMFSPNNQAPHSTDAVMFGIHHMKTSYSVLKLALCPNYTFSTNIPFPKNSEHFIILYATRY